jgi:gamma-glutamyltranspeptidase / glutathione hydrolase
MSITSPEPQPASMRIAERHTPPHEAVTGTRGVASSAYPLATQAALDILQRGGSAVDAAIAAGAVLTVVMPSSGALGGDVFFLVSDSDGDVRAVNGSGAAPLAATREIYAGMGEIPDSGWRASTVPGMVDGWQVAHKRWGKLPWNALFEAAIHYANDGFVVSPSLEMGFTFGAEKFRHFPETARIFLAEGRPPQAGEVLKQPDLANTFLAIRDDGPDVFYEGDIARAIVEASSRQDGLFSLEDFARHSSVEPDPIQVAYRDTTVYGQPPVSQGIILLMALGTLNEMDLRATGAGTADTVHLQVEAIKQGFADRVTYLGDPNFVDVPIQEMLSIGESQRRANAIDLARRSNVLMEPAHADTTSLVTADSDGNIVAYIHSLYAGSGVVVPGTGIMMNNRALGFSLDPTSPNVLAPGKRPVHTLNQALVKHGDDVYAIGTPGANLQVQHNLQVICNLIDFDIKLQAAVDAPRWSMGDQMRIGDDQLMIEDRFGPDVIGDLSRRGHNMVTAPAWQVGGGIQVARINRRNGVLWAARDPRRPTNLASAI